MSRNLATQRSRSLCHGLDNLTELLRVDQTKGKITGINTVRK